MSEHSGRLYYSEDKNALAWGMTVHRLIQDASYEPETIDLMAQAYEEACRRLGGGQPAAILETVAKRILEAARRGERDPERLTAFGVRGLDRSGNAA